MRETLQSVDQAELSDDRRERILQEKVLKRID